MISFPVRSPAAVTAVTGCIQLNTKEKTNRKQKRDIEGDGKRQGKGGCMYRINRNKKHQQSEIFILATTAFCRLYIGKRLICDRVRLSVDEKAYRRVFDGNAALPRYDFSHILRKTAQNNSVRRRVVAGEKERFAFADAHQRIVASRGDYEVPIRLFDVHPERSEFTRRLSARIRAAAHAQSIALNTITTTRATLKEQAGRDGSAENDD